MKSQQLITAILILIIFQVKVYVQENIKSTCGIRLINHKTLVTKTFQSNEGDWPWHAAIYHLTRRSAEYKCGGTILTSNSILTAAHCVYENNRPIVSERVLVHLGTLNYLLSGAHTQEFQVYRIIPHPSYDGTNVGNDIAIIRLATEATLNNYVQPICLWDSNKIEISEVIGKFGTVVGWGATETGELSDILRQASMPVVSSLTCLESNRDVFGMFLSDKNFCAGFRNGTGACNGDSGGPILFEINGVYHIRGIVSLAVNRRGEQLCNPEEYVLFTDVAKYLTWIEEIVPELERSSSILVATAPANLPTTTSITDLDNDDFPLRNNFYNEFDFKLTKALMLTDPSNMILSPFLVKFLLALLTEAAGEDTTVRREIAAVLPSSQTYIQAREFYGKMYGSLLEKSTDYELNMGTKMYLSEFIQPRQRLIAIADTYYFSKVETIDFENAIESAKTINDWCANVTHNHIQELVKGDDIKESVMIMVNALYFNSYWGHPFPPNATVQSPFFTTPTTQVITSFMAATDKFYYMESESLQAKILQLPYKGPKFAMTILLPNARTSLDDMIRRLETSTFNGERMLMKKDAVRVRLPKFKFDYTSKLNDVLKDIGIKSVFTNGASLPALARSATVQGRLQLSMVLQKAGIFVNEQGSTAYTATEISFKNSFGDYASRDFIANRPFMFIIEDETTLLFAGKVTNPSIFAL